MQDSVVESIVFVKKQERCLYEINKLLFIS